MSKGLWRAAMSRRVALPMLAAPFIVRRARAEANTLRIARQFGIGYVQMSILEDRKLIEKHAAAAGLGAIEVGWSTFRSSDVMNDALLSGGLDIASLGVPGLATIWDRTAGARYEVKGLCGFNAAPIALVTREALVHGLADYRPGMKIAMPAAKVSNQAIYLQMAAAKLWGPAEYARLDPLTISMSHPDAVAALLSKSEIGSYFGAPPYTQRALKDPAVHQVTDSTEILGKPASFNILGMPTRFYEGNPTLVRAFLAALDEATASATTDRLGAAATYARLANDRTPVAELAEVMAGAMTYTLDLQGSIQIATFMASVGVLKHTPKAWTEYMHPSARAYAGS